MHLCHVLIGAEACVCCVPHVSSALCLGGGGGGGGGEHYAWGYTIITFMGCYVNVVSICLCVCAFMGPICMSVFFFRCQICSYFCLLSTPPQKKNLSFRPHRRQMMPQTRRPHPPSRPSTAQLVEPPPLSLHPATPTPPHHTPQGPPPPPSHNQVASTTTSSPDGMLIVYHLGDLPTPYAKRIGSSQITLGEFKVKIFAKNPGEYRCVFVPCQACSWEDV